MSVDIVITTYRSPDKLKTCLSSILERTKFVDYKVYVWANDPNDEVEQVLYDSMHVDDIMFNDHIIPIFNDDNTGSFSSNNNNAAEEGDADYILFLNDDTEIINDDWLLNMTRILDTDSKAGVVGALLMYPDKKTIQHCGVFFSHRTNNLPFHMFYKQPLSKVASFVSKPRYYQCVTGACMLVRRADFNKVGGMDEGYFYSFEDVDLCLSIKKQLGKSSVFCPRAQLIHNEGVSGTQPNLKDNVNHLRERYDGFFFNDEMFYMNSKDYMVYKYKTGNNNGE